MKTDKTKDKISAVAKMRNISYSAANIDDDKIRFVVDDPQIEHRTMHLEIRADGDPDEVDLSFSSEYPVDRWGEAEILSHEPDAAHFERLATVGSVLWNHNADVPVGVPTKIYLDADSHTGRAKMRWGTDEESKRIRQKVVDGTVRGVSVGYVVKEWVYLQSEDVSYGRWNGPAMIATNWEALEFSLTPVPADPSVGVGRSAKQTGKARSKGEGKMERKVKLTRQWADPDGVVHEAGSIVECDEARFLELTEGDEPYGAEHKERKAEPKPQQTRKQEGETAEQMIERKLREDRERRAGIRAQFEKYGVDVDHDIVERCTVGQANEYILGKLAERAANPQTTVQVTRDGNQSFCRAAALGLQVRAGVKVDKDELKDTGYRDFAGMSLPRLAEECLRRSGRSIPANPLDLAREALRGEIDWTAVRHGETISSSTSDFPYILANTANKSMLEGVANAPTTYRQWCKIGTSPDFKTFSRIRLSEAGKLEEVPEGGTYNMTKFSDRREQGAVLTYGKAFSLSRQMIINDDLNALTEIPRSMGRIASILPNDLAVTVLLANGNMSDGNALFSSTHSNIDQETDRQLDTLAHAKALINKLIEMMYQQNNYQHADVAASEKLNLRLDPKVFLIPPTGMQYAREALKASGFFNGSGTSAIDYNHLSEFGIIPAIEPSLEDTNLTGYSTTATYMFADPNVAPIVEVTFLNGMDTPFLEEVENTGTAADGRVMKVRMDCTASKVDWLGAIKATGADA